MRRINRARKERIVMLVSSVFVLAALTVTGIYMKKGKDVEKDDGYTLDFTSIENGENRSLKAKTGTEEHQNMDGELDYMPLEVDSGNVRLPGSKVVSGEADPAVGKAEKKSLTKKQPSGPAPKEELPALELPSSELPVGELPLGELPLSELPAEEIPVMEEASNPRILHFAEDAGMLRPLAGETLLPFSMDKSIYFPTLDQYKRNPALILDAEEGAEVIACAEGLVIGIFETKECGTGLTLNLGDGYELTYGQLDNVTVKEGDYVQPGELLGVIAAPSAYYSVEGANLYLKLTKDGTPVNPEVLFR